MKTSDPIKVLKTLYLESLSELIEHYSGDPVEFTEREMACADSACAATVGFSDKDFKGSAILIVSHQSCMSQLGSPDESTESDWIGELGNQLAGRFKNKVSAFGPLMQLGLPSVVCSRELCYGHENNVGCWQLNWHGFLISSMLNVEVSETGLQLNVLENPSVASEGSLCLF